MVTFGFAFSGFSDQYQFAVENTRFIKPLHNANPRLYNEWGYGPFSLTWRRRAPSHKHIAISCFFGIWLFRGRLAVLPFRWKIPRLRYPRPGHAVVEIGPTVLQFLKQQSAAMEVVME